MLSTNLRSQETRSRHASCDARRRPFLHLTVVLALSVGSLTAGGQELLWDNNIRSVTNGRAVSPPAFPDIRVVDDFDAEPPGWVITGFHANVFEDAG